MPHYEYKISSPEALYDEWQQLHGGRVGTQAEALNDFAKAGWRLVAVDSSVQGHHHTVMWYLERWVD